VRGDARGRAEIAAENRVSARYRQHKRKLMEAQHALAAREVDLVSYVRVINDMLARGLPAQTQIMCRDEIWIDCKRLRGVVAELESAVPA